MAVTTLDTNAVSTASKGTASFTLTTLVRMVFTYLERRKAIAQLNTMTDRELLDLGLTRGSIEAAVHGRL